MRTTETPQDQFNELSYYTLAHDRTYFIHQHAVDAFAAQTADENTKPIKITFALIGLYLFLEKGFTGKQVQQAHVKMSQSKEVWPSLPLPHHRGEITVADVLQEEPGERRDLLIRKWCESVWREYDQWHEATGDLVRRKFGV